MFTFVVYSSCSIEFTPFYPDVAFALSALSFCLISLNRWTHSFTDFPGTLDAISFHLSDFDIFTVGGNNRNPSSNASCCSGVHICNFLAASTAALVAELTLLGLEGGSSWPLVGFSVFLVSDFSTFLLGSEVCLLSVVSFLRFCLSSSAFLTHSFLLCFKAEGKKKGKMLRVLAQK